MPSKKSYKSQYFKVTNKPEDIKMKTNACENILRQMKIHSLSQAFTICSYLRMKINVLAI